MLAAMHRWMSLRVTDVLGPETALLDAVVVALTADAAVAALVGPRIFDQVPTRTEAPYIYAGQMASSFDGGECARYWTVGLRLYVVSTDFGRLMAWAVLNAARAALDGADLVMPAPFILMEPPVIVRAGDIIDPITPRSTYLDLKTLIST